MKEISRHRIEVQAEEILDLRAGDQNGDTIREADHNWPRKIFDRGTHTRGSEKKQKDASHHRADKEAVDAVLGDDSRYNNNECAGWAADLRLGTTERGNEKTGDDCAVLV